MSQSIEIRSPFIDYRLMEFGLSLPMDELFSKGITKKVLRSGFEDRLPACIAHNHNKIGFATPFDKWSRSPAFLVFVTGVVTSQEFLGRHIWDGAALATRMLDPDAAEKGFPVWRFLVAELWMRGFGITNA